MFGLTTLGSVHTAISLVALAAAAGCFFRDGAISPHKRLGRLCIWMTVATCLTGFGIFQHGGFGKPHALGIITLVVLGVAAVAGRTTFFGRTSPYVETIAFSATVFFHMIPAITEGGTRLPLGAPKFNNPEAPELLAATGVVFLLFLVGVSYQLWRLRGKRPITTLA
jgi:hypothetical protein